MAINVKVNSIETTENGAFVISLIPYRNDKIADNVVFIQTELYTAAGIAVTPHGTLIYDGTERTPLESTLNAPTIYVGGRIYNNSTEMFEFADFKVAPTEQVFVGSELTYGMI